MNIVMVEMFILLELLMSGNLRLINSLLKHYAGVTDNLITTSEFPGTTLDLIEIPLDDKIIYMIRLVSLIIIRWLI